MAREISSVASVVYVADRSLHPDQATKHGNIHHNPALVRFLDLDLNLGLGLDLDSVEIQKAQKAQKVETKGVVSQQQEGGEGLNNGEEGVVEVNSGEGVDESGGSIGGGGGIVQFANGKKEVVDIVLWCTGDRANLPSTNSNLP